MKILRISIVLTLVFVAIFGFAFPGLITVAAQAAFPYQANGSLVKNEKGEVVGSELIGQAFSAPAYFHPRPSAAGNGYDAGNSGATNLGSTSDKLVNGVHKKTPDGKDDPGNFDGVVDLAKAYRDENGLAPDADLPADAVTRSASGLDPDISPRNAELQMARVAKARGVTVAQITERVRQLTQARFLGVYGEPRVNVLLLNRDLDAHFPAAIKS
jgi:K+-transporting ATPase ATPase C chain